MADDLKKYSSLSSATLPVEQARDTQEVIDYLTHELAARELHTRFIDALERGEIEGDILIVDELGNEVKGTSPRVTIFDVK